METTKEIVLGQGRKVVRCGGEESIFFFETGAGGWEVGGLIDVTFYYY